MSNEADAPEDTRGKEIVLRLGQLGVEVAAQALQLGLASSFINCAVDVWRIKARPKQEQLAAALLARSPNLMERLEAAATDGTDGLRADELELIGVGMSALSPSANAERIERMAKLVTDGLGATDIDASRAKRLASLLGQLDDEHLLVLMRYDMTASSAERKRLIAANPHIFPGPEPRPDLGERLRLARAGFETLESPPKPTEAELREAAAQKLHLKLCCDHLFSLGLLTWGATADGPDPRRYSITRAGHEFLRSIGLLSMADPNKRPFW